MAILWRARWLTPYGLQNQEISFYLNFVFCCFSQYVSQNIFHHNHKQGTRDEEMNLLQLTAKVKGRAAQVINCFPKRLFFNCVVVK